MLRMVPEMFRGEAEMILRGGGVRVVAMLPLALRSFGRVLVNATGNVRLV